MTANVLNDRMTHTKASKIFANALWCVLAIWLVASSLACVIQAWLAPQLTTLMTTVSLGSGMVGVFAMLPGIFLQQPESSIQNLSPGRRVAMTAQFFLIGSVAAMAIRFAGTVALFVACRYQFGLSEKTIAIFVCLWYVLLTSLEIFFLARGAASIDSTPDSRVNFSQSPSTDSTFG
ncbi:hypothetical protein [Rubripirellula reticaptiva]|uniref:Uncharacterized protein n=1 Tax=Rubripirellula reticaptiva TaxID=2528013 RepID=A0A5C6F2C5_9BACT|nr:hypothetical protein [Rubripirellula reticaptiva]TWU55275.1 hypothetical protein Poly59_15720 [Rubripirellula reticaptiva]